MSAAPAPARAPLKRRFVNRANGIILLIFGLAFLPVSLFMFLGTSFAAHGVILVPRTPLELGKPLSVEVRPSQGEMAHVDVTVDLPRTPLLTDEQRVGAGFPMRVRLSDLSGATLFEESAPLKPSTPRVSVYKPREAPETARVAWRAQWLSVPREGFRFEATVEPSSEHPQITRAAAMVYGEPKLKPGIRLLPLLGLVFLVSGATVLFLSRRASRADPKA